MLLLTELLVLLGCAPATEAEVTNTSSVPTLTETATTTTTATTTATSETGGTTSTYSTKKDDWMVSYSGFATVDDAGFTGAEVLRAVDEGGEGDAQCVIETQLSGTELRDDCDAPATTCFWAYDLVRSGSTLVKNQDDACARTFGIDPGAVSDLNGMTEAYGHGDFAGHADVLVMWFEGAWEVGGYASWDGKKGAFQWERTGY